MASRPAALKLLRYPGLRALFAFLILIGLALLYGRVNFYRDPLSVFYNPERAHTRWYSAFRESQANAYIEQVAADHAKGRAFRRAGPDPKLCATFLTTKREGPQYIESSIGSVLEGLTEVERSALYLASFFTNSDPAIHPTWNTPWLASLLDEAYTYNVSDERLEELKRYETVGAVKPKGVFDYTYALQHCYEQGAEWVALFEGDVIFASGWFARMLDGLRQIEEVLRLRTSDWIFMRLFNQERSTGWSNRYVGGNNEHWISLGIDLVALPLLFIARRKSPGARRHLDNWTLAVLCFLAIPSMVVLFFKAGKASMLPPSPGVRIEPFGCCSQAMVFSRDQVPPTIQYLRERVEGQVDLMLNDRSRATGLARIALYPVQVQHIGMTSARGTTSSDAQAIWSMAFEMLDPTALQREHVRLVEQLFGND